MSKQRLSRCGGRMGAHKGTKSFDFVRLNHRRAVAELRFEVEPELVAKPETRRLSETKNNAEALLEEVCGAIVPQTTR